MRPTFPKTKALVSLSNLLDAWWVNVNGETIAEPQTLEQALANKPSRSKAKVLVLHTSLADEWIPIRDLERLIKLHSYDPQRAEEESLRIAVELEQFQIDLPKELEYLRQSRGLLMDPSPEQVQLILLEFETRAKQGDYLDSEEIIIKACPECFDPIALESQDLYEEVLQLHDIFEGLDSEFLFLYESENKTLCITEVLNSPTRDQLATVLKTFKNGWSSRNESSYNECPGNRKLAKRIAKLFPELVKDNPEALQFFSPQVKRERKTPTCKSPTSIGQPKEVDGKKEVTITIGPVTIVVFVLVLGVLMSRCFS